jgi:hypothetical protein
MLSLRPGDKSSYAVPAFIQGALLRLLLLGRCTLYDIGAGLTFFERRTSRCRRSLGSFNRRAAKDIYAPANMRYGGNVFGLKMLAITRAYLCRGGVLLRPRTICGSRRPRATRTAKSFPSSPRGQSGKPHDSFSALLIQLEFPRVTIPKAKDIQGLSPITRSQFWFISDRRGLRRRSNIALAILTHITAASGSKFSKVMRLGVPYEESKENLGGTFSSR